MPLISQTLAQSKFYDLVVVGAGAAGLALAFHCAGAGLATLVVERGGTDPDQPADPDGEPIVPEGVPHDPRVRTNCEIVGGTLTRWGGRCVPYDPEDFGPRQTTSEPGWPISYDDYAQWIDPASAFLHCTGPYQLPAPAGWQDVPGLITNRVERLNAANLSDLLREQVTAQPDGPDVVTDTTVLGFDWQAEGQGEDRVGGLRLATGGVPWQVACGRCVLAAGGLETTRLLLQDQADRGGAPYGGPEGPLGRYYMGHLTGSIATITLNSRDVVAAFRYDDAGGVSPGRRRLVPAAEGGLNTAFWLEPLPPHDPGHRSGEESLKHLLRTSGKTEQRGEHLRNLMRNPAGAMAAAGAFARRHLRPGERAPARLPAATPGPFLLAYHAEHLPLADSRVVLETARDTLGRQKIRIDFRYGQDTIDALVAAHRHLARQLAEAGLARVDMPGDDAACAAQIEGLARDGYHQIGMTRMADDPADGVVDRDGRVHGTGNLHIASSSVFPVSSQANPTLTVVAMALRLADQLCRTQAARAPATAQ